MLGSKQDRFERVVTAPKGHPFLNPQLGSRSLDTFGARRSILLELARLLPRLSGRLLDVGCGNMPYRQMLLNGAVGITAYVGLDVSNDGYSSPNVVWNGVQMPVSDQSVDVVLLTEVLEHCPDTTAILREVARVLKASGFLFLTVPFLWPLHDVPYDEYRFSPFSLERHLHAAGFDAIEIRALGGWNASLAQMLGLWVARSPMRNRWIRRALSILLTPLIRWLYANDRPPGAFTEGTMVTGFSVLAFKAAETR